MAEPAPARPWIGYALLALWALAGVAGLGTLAVSHTVALPPPDEEARLTAALMALRTRPAQPLVVDVVAAGCSCTDRLIKHLLARGPAPGAEELLLYVGDDPALRAAFTARGFGFATVSPDDLAPRFDLDAAPVLLTFDRSGRLDYVGGYFDNPSALSPLDERVLAGAVTTPLPVYGCAVSPRLKKAVDPLGIVY